jgi:hypothetical protein
MTTMSSFPLSGAFYDVRDALGVPPPTARRGNTPRVQRLHNLPQRVCTGLLDLADDRKDIRRVLVCASPDRRHSALTGLESLGLPRVTPRTLAAASV